MRFLSLLPTIRQLFEEHDRLREERDSARLEIAGLKNQLASQRPFSPLSAVEDSKIALCGSEESNKIESGSPGYFIVTSHGRTASYWLASALHQHPDIICGHSRQHPPIPDYGRPMDWANVQQILAETGKEHWDGLVRAEKTYPDDYFDELVKCGKAKFYGCVHTFTFYGLMQDFAQMPPRRSYRIVNLTRHPVSRITSWKNRVVEEWRYSNSAREFWLGIYQTSEPHRSLAQYARETLGIDSGDEATLAAICAFIDVAAETLEISQDLTTVPMERLVADHQYFCWLLRLLTRPDVEIDQEYLATVFARGKLNPSHYAAQLPFIEYSKWQAWERSLFQEVCRRWPIVQKFSPLGYDLSFINR